MKERLQKIIAAAGICSRRAAEDLLRQGRVTALVGCTGLDLTSPEILDMLWIRLKLEGT